MSAFVSIHVGVIRRAEIIKHECSHKHTAALLLQLVALAQDFLTLTHKLLIDTAVAGLFGFTIELQALLGLEMLNDDFDQVRSDFDLMRRVQDVKLFGQILELGQPEQRDDLLVGVYGALVDEEAFPGEFDQTRSQIRRNMLIMQRVRSDPVVLALK